MPNQQPVDPAQAQANLDQVREILFGRQSRDFEDRVEQLRQQLTEGLASLRATIQDRTDALTRKIDEEIRQVHERLESHERHAEQVRVELNARIQQGDDQSNQRLDALSETLQATEQSIRADAAGELQDVKSQLHSTLDQLGERMQRDVNQVSGESVSRRALSQALRVLSAQLLAEADDQAAEGAAE